MQGNQHTGPYGEMARRHWEKYLPNLFETLKDSGRLESRLSQVNRQATRQVAQLTCEIMSKEPEVRTLERARLEAMARKQAEEAVLQELILLPAEADQTAA